MLIPIDDTQLKLLFSCIHIAATRCIIIRHLWLTFTLVYGNGDICTNIVYFGDGGVKHRCGLVSFETRLYFEK